MNDVKWKIAKHCIQSAPCPETGRSIMLDMLATAFCMSLLKQIDFLGKIG